MTGITWDSFKYHNSANKPDAFEEMCRRLFVFRFCPKDTTFPHNNSNQCGVEILPVIGNDSKKISFQAKFFDGNIDYSQIEHSVDVTIKNFVNELEIYYIYCNKNITTTSKLYKKISDKLNNVGITPILICNEEILIYIKNNAHTDFFTNIVNDYFKGFNQSSFSEMESISQPYVKKLEQKVGVLTIRVDELEPLDDENKILVDEIYKNIVNAKMLYDDEVTWKRLKPYVENESNQKNKHYANFFFLAAQMCLAFSKQDAEKYNKIASNLCEKYDPRLFSSAVLINGGRYDETFELLKNIDSTNVLNLYLACLYYAEQGDKCDDVMNAHSDIKHDETTLYVSALCYLQMSDFDRAEVNMNKLLEKHPTSIKIMYDSAVVKFWSYSNIIDRYKPSLSLIMPGVYTPYLTYEQISGLRETIELFRKISILADSMSPLLNKMALSGCLICAWTIRDKEASQFRDELFKIDIANSVAVLYTIATNGTFSDETINALKKSAIDGQNYQDVSALLNYYISINDFESFHTIISDISQYKDFYSNEDLLNLQLDVLQKEGDYDQLEKLLSESSACTEFKERAIFVVTANNNISNKNSIEKLGKNLISNYGRDIDYINMAFFYYKHRNWGQLKYISEKWYKKYDSIYAMMYIAIALFNSKKIQDAKIVIDALEKRADLTPGLRDIRIHLLINESQYDEAIKLIEKDGLHIDNEGYANALSDMYANLGEFEKSIYCLKKYTDNNPGKLASTYRLINRLQLIDQQSAYLYAKQLGELYPNDPKIIMFWMELGFHTGHDDEVIHLITKINLLQKNKKTKNRIKGFKTLNFKQAIKFYNERSQIIKDNTQDYISGKLSIHAYIDMVGNSALSEIIYNNWNQVDITSSLFWHFGGRQDTIYKGIINTKKIIMDYSAWLTAYCLDLFNVLSSFFDVIYVEPNLLQVIDSELLILKKRFQPNIIESETVLLDFIEGHKDKIKIVKAPCLDDYVFDDGWRDKEQIFCSDIVELLSANSVNAFIATNEFATELAHDINMPNEYTNKRVRINEVYDILIENEVIEGSISSDHNSRKLVKGSRILVDRELLLDITRKTTLDKFVGFFDVYICENIYNSLRANRDAFNKNSKTISWLMRFRDNMIQLIKTRAVRFLKKSDINIKNADKLGVLIRSFTNCMSGTQVIDFKDSGISIWCDDRFFNGCNLAVSIFDILRAMAENDVITKDVYFKYVSKLLSHRVKYYIPSVDYVFDCLFNSEVVNSKISETIRLANIRHSINENLNSKSSIGTDQVNFGGKIFIPELSAYLDNLRFVFQGVIYQIWNCNTKDIDWKSTSTYWCLINLFDFANDSTLVQKDKLEHLLASKHFSLIQAALTINIAYRASYVSFIFGLLNYRWSTYPDEFWQVIDVAADSINNITVDSSTENEQLQNLIIIQLLQIMPADFMYHLLTSRKFNGKWESLNPYKLTEPDGGDEPDSVEIPNDKLITIVADDYNKYLAQNPDKWYETFCTIAQQNQENPCRAVIDFLERYIDNNNVTELPQDCLDSIAFFAWQCPPEDIPAANELRRKLP
jgi:hypothetical protein